MPKKINCVGAIPKEVEKVEEEEEEKVSPKDLKTSSRKRTFTLYKYKGDGPKNGGSYSGSPASAAKKCANRWIVPKKSYGKPVTFQLLETTPGKANPGVYTFKVQRTKLKKPRIYTRGGNEIKVESQIELM